MSPCSFLVSTSGVAGFMSKKPDLDDATIRIAERMLRMPPKPHENYNVGKSKAKSATSGRGRKRTKKPAS